VTWKPKAGDVGAGTLPDDRDVVPAVDRDLGQAGAVGQADLALDVDRDGASRAVDGGLELRAARDRHDLAAAAARGATIHRSKAMREATRHASCSTSDRASFQAWAGNSTKERRCGLEFIHWLMNAGATVALVTQPMIICLSRTARDTDTKFNPQYESESLSFRIQVAGGERRAGYLRSMRPRGMPARTFPN
jgi:hypothetical protein